MSNDKKVLISESVQFEQSAQFEKNVYLNQHNLGE